MASSVAAASAPTLLSSRSPSVSGLTTLKSSQLTCVKVMHRRTHLSHGLSCRAVVTAEYSGRRGGGAGDFVAGFLLGGAVFGALGYVLAPQITKTLEKVEGVKGDEEDTKRPAEYLEDDEGLENTRKNLNEKIVQLNAAIDDVSAQLRNEDAFGMSNVKDPLMAPCNYGGRRNFNKEFTFSYTDQLGGKFFNVTMSSNVTSAHNFTFDGIHLLNIARAFLTGKQINMPEGGFQYEPNFSRFDGRI